METALSAANRHSRWGWAGSQWEGKAQAGGQKIEEWPVACTQIGLAQVSFLKFGALKILTKTLGQIAAVEGFSTSSYYLFEGTVASHPRESRKWGCICLPPGAAFMSVYQSPTWAWGQVGSSVL